MYTYICSLLNLLPTSPLAHPSRSSQSTQLNRHFFLSLKIKNSNTKFYLPLTTSRSNLTFLPVLCNCLFFLSQLSGFGKKICSILIQGINTGKLLFLMWLWFRRRFILEFEEVGRQGRSVFGGQTSYLVLPTGQKTSPLLFLHSAHLLGRGLADLLFQLLVCVPFFVAESTWLDFPSEVITYLSFPYKICSLKN